MQDLFNIAKPQGCDIQTFIGSGRNNVAGTQQSWSKPTGVSHVYMMLIGAGGSGNDGSVGGGSGAVTVWYGAAQHVPDNLVVIAGVPQLFGFTTYVNSTVNARLGNQSSLSELLIANSGQYTAGGVAMTANPFAASGFFKSVTGQSAGGTVNASPTTFLSAGSNGTVLVNYGYPSYYGGYFQMQPIIIGVSSANGASESAGIGCGAAGSASSTPGAGLVLIASW